MGFFLLQTVDTHELCLLHSHFWFIFVVSTQGGMPGASTFRDCKSLENMVKKHVEKGKLYAAICAAPAVALGAWGLLNGLKVIVLPIIHFCVPCIIIFYWSKAHFSFCDRPLVILHSWRNFLQRLKLLNQGYRLMGSV